MMLKLMYVGPEEVGYLHATNPRSIPSTPYGPLRPTKSDPWELTKSSAQLGVAQKKQKK